MFMFLWIFIRETEITAQLQRFYCSYGQNIQWHFISLAIVIRVRIKVSYTIHLSIFKKVTMTRGINSQYIKGILFP